MLAQIDGFHQRRLSCASFLVCPCVFAQSLAVQVTSSMADEVIAALQDFDLQTWSEQIVSVLGVSCLSDFAFLLEQDLSSLDLKPVQKRKLWKLCELQQQLAACGHLAPVTPQALASALASPPAVAAPETPPGEPQAVPVAGAADVQIVSCRKRRKFEFQPVQPDSRFSTDDGLSADAQNGSKALLQAVRLWKQKTDIDIGRCRNPWKLKAGKCSTSAICIGHTDCRVGNGKRFRFVGQWQGESYILNASSCGTCSGELTAARKRKRGDSKLPLTRKDRQLILKAHQDLMATGNGDRPRPADVAAKLGRDVLERLPPSSLRAVLRGVRKPGTRGRMRLRKTRKMRGPVSWTGELERFFAARQDPNGDGVCCVFRELGPVVTSFVLLAPPFFRELEKLRDAAVISDSQGLPTRFSSRVFKICGARPFIYVVEATAPPHPPPTFLSASGLPMCWLFETNLFK